MAKSLGEVMSEKSDEELMDFLNSFNKYTPEAITVPALGWLTALIPKTRIK
jgi:hypothetical protein